MTRTTTGGMALLLALAACGDAERGLQGFEEDPRSVETERLHAWLDGQFEEQLAFSPQTRTFLGEKTDYDRLDDFTPEAEERSLDWLRRSVDAMREEFDRETLSEDGRVSWDMWEYSLEQAEKAWPWRRHGYIFGRGGPHASIPSFLISFHRVDDASDLEAYIARLGEIDRALGELLERARRAAAEGVRQPRFGYDFAIAEIGRVTGGAPFGSDDGSPNSPLWTDLQTKTAGLVESGAIDADAARDHLERARAALSGEVAAAYRALAAWLEADRENAPEESRGVWALPGGGDYYRWRLDQMTTLPLSAEEIHRTGLDEVERLRGEMEAIRERVGFDGGLEDFFVHLREDERFYFPDTDQGRRDYLDLNNRYLDAMSEQLPRFFGRLPKAALEVRRVEAFREQPGAAQHYRPGSPDGSRPGVFYSHMSDMSALAIWQIENIAYHEGNPGHHMQISIQQELTDVPRFRTQYRTTAYTEGWALYTEWLAREMGGYEDPYSAFGQLSGEMWRAIRLVVDTGIHAMRWSEERAARYFLDNSPIPESAVRSEVQRYFANPGQATAYKIGMISIQQARSRAERELGADFDIRAFHDVVLGAGALPMPMLRARVDRWIAEARGAAAAAP